MAGALLVVDELKEHSSPTRGGLGALFFDVGLKFVLVQRGAVPDGDVTARGGQAVDAGDQLLQGGGRKVDQQALGNPRGGLGRIKAAVPQCLWPIITQIDLDLATRGVRCRAVRRKHLTLEGQDLRLVQLEDRRPVTPRQPVRPGVQPRRQDDHLSHAGVGGPAEIPVEIPGAGALEVDEMLAEVAGLQRVVGNLAIEDVGGGTADGTAEHLRVGVDGQRVGLLRLQRSRGRYE